MAIQTSLVSISTDGKILVWRLEDKLRYPIKGHMLAKKKGAETTVIGGTAMDITHVMNDNNYLVGTEGGQIFKCSINPPSDGDVSHFFDQG